MVFKIGSEIVGEEASTIKLTMEPPPTTTKEVEKGRALDPNEYKMALAAALNISKEAVLSAKQHLPLLITSEIEIEVAFTVKKNAEGGISISPIGIGELTVGANIGGKLSKSQVHKLKLLFSKGK